MVSLNSLYDFIRLNESLLQFRFIQVFSGLLHYILQCIILKLTVTEMTIQSNLVFVKKYILHPFI